MNNMKLSWDDVEKLTFQLTGQIVRSDWKPDYVIGVGRGGALPAILIGNFFGVVTRFADISLRRNDTVSILTLSEDVAFGMKVLIVDDFTRTGATFDYIKHDWDCPVTPIAWHTTVKFAVLHNCHSSQATVDYYVECVDQPPSYPWL